MVRKLIGVAGAGSLFVMGLLAAPGCSCSEKSDPEPVVQAKYPDLPSFCNAVAQATCQDSLINACLVSGKDACVKAVGNSCVALQNDITRNVVLSHYAGANPAANAAIDACVAAVQAAYSDAKIDASEHTSLLKSCADVFPGVGKVGDSCEALTPCSTGLFCYSADGKTGTCQQPIPVATGEDCTKVGSDCGDDGYCLTGDDRICGKRKNLGDPCNDVTKPCLNTLLCSNQDANGNGSCTAKKDQGQDCTTKGDAECSSGYCAQVGDKHLCANSLSFGAGAPACQTLGGT